MHHRYRMLVAIMLYALGHAAATACEEPRAEQLRRFGVMGEACSHSLCGLIHATQRTDRSPAITTEACKDPVRSELLDAIRRTQAKGGIVLLGETHDNASHHIYRAHILRMTQAATQRAPRPKRTAVVFEHIRRDQQPALDLFVELGRNGQHIGSASTLLRLLKWDASGWPEKTIFEPLFKATIDVKAAILSGDPPRDTVRSVARQSFAALSAKERTRLKLDDEWPPELQSALIEEIEASHCGMLPKSHLPNMAAAQRYRDAHLAAALAEAAASRGSAFLIAGNGHVRSDRGVPFYLRRLAPGRNTLSVMLAEVEDGKPDPATYIPRDATGKPAVDYVVFTPRAKRKDPCTEMREQFSKMPR